MAVTLATSVGGTLTALYASRVCPLRRVCRVRRACAVPSEIHLLAYALYTRFCYATIHSTAGALLSRGSRGCGRSGVHLTWLAFTPIRAAMPSCLAGVQCIIRRTG